MGAIDDVIEAAESQGIIRPKVEIDRTITLEGGGGRIVLYDAYSLATHFSINGCTCCIIPDYMLHFKTSRLYYGKPVYLRHDGWPDDYAHALQGGDCPDISASRERLPRLIQFYREKGVPDGLLTQVEQEITELIDSTEYFIENGRE